MEIPNGTDWLGCGWRMRERDLGCEAEVGRWFGNDAVVVGWVVGTGFSCGGAVVGWRVGYWSGRDWDWERVGSGLTCRGVLAVLILYGVRGAGWLWELESSSNAEIRACWHLCLAWRWRDWEYGKARC